MNLENPRVLPSGQAGRVHATQPSDDTPCFHCGQVCGGGGIFAHEKAFCCRGCLTVHDILAESGLDRFYELGPNAGIRIAESAPPGHWMFLDDPEVASKLLDFTDGKISRVTFHIPSIHCVACVWLLENLFRLDPGIGRSTVNFPLREVAIVFSPEKIPLSRLVALLASIGYEPRLMLSELDQKAAGSDRKKRWLQIGLAGFAFGNVMLVSLPLYLGLDSLSGLFLRKLFGYLSLALALPVLTYSASDYWRSAAASIRQRTLTLDVPIALGLAALYLQSAWEILSATGGGYLDSLCGLVFFLLCGRMFQHKIHDRIAFDGDYKSFFPLSTRRVRSNIEESAALSDLKVGDHLRLRHGELIPADGRLVSGEALIDYSFVTGESEPVTCAPAAYVYAGGKQIGGVIEVEIVKAVSQSYLVSLWNHEAFRKDSSSELNSLTNRYSRRFTVLVVMVAFAAAAGWILAGQPARGLKAFTSVLIVACPCALALAAPFALGTAQRILTKLQVFLRNVLVLERISRVDTIVFDKTGTLTTPDAGPAEFKPAVSRGNLSPDERSALRSLAAQSLHPHSVRIAESLSDVGIVPVNGYEEQPGNGISGIVQGRVVRLGSAAWLKAVGIECPAGPDPQTTGTCVAIDGQYLGAFVLLASLRKDVENVLTILAKKYEVALLSGDNERDRGRFLALLGPGAQLHFNQSPLQKLQFIERLQSGEKRTVMMIGDGLNDAGALKQSDVGVAVVGAAGAFSPSSDVILEASMVGRLAEILELARRGVRIVRLSFLVSAVYNALGIAIAAAGILSPVICAILMPLSSISVVLFACGLTSRAAGKLGLHTRI